MKPAPVVVFGKSGQLAQELSRLNTPARPIICIGRDDFDLSRSGDPRALIEAHAPAFVINAAAYTAVDRAEIDPEAAYALNRDGPHALARACATAQAPFLHVSTDYVFDGSKRAPYTEEDPRQPLGAYGASKAAGEDAVLAAGGRSAIVRVAWLYSAYGSNFAKTMLRLAETRDEIAVVDDQIGRPTPARFLAETLMTLGARLANDEPRARGVFHLATHGDATWADFAEAVFAHSAARGGQTARVKRIMTAAYPTAARRPADSRLDPSKLEALLTTRFPDWREPLHALIDALIPAEESIGA